ncbi:hypothetical protein M2360_001064 [Rhizobium sp. SG_E_25_P2]|jgi:hypothetical protein|uniref:hypothetical protein n=1 Tax=Rhizobium sp. SG_E_25_P2 TaxID=2879942 RepID=UPI0024772153|nr:hypothetical protein [Rhizobium sp. SG_E_25_P2]MDH6265674.1 hypothetical protein [Rhizobium sp. SG_E_25_P2]
MAKWLIHYIRDGLSVAVDTAIFAAQQFLKAILQHSETGRGDPLCQTPFFRKERA